MGLLASPAFSFSRMRWVLRVLAALVSLRRRARTPPMGQPGPSSTPPHEAHPTKQWLHTPEQHHHHTPPSAPTATAHSRSAIPLFHSPLHSFVPLSFLAHTSPPTTIATEILFIVDDLIPSSRLSGDAHPAT
jgi:hypothetical protein